MATILDLVMSEEMFDNYEEVSLENMWRIVRVEMMNHGFFQDNECPVPYFLLRNYFDIFNVFLINPTLTFLRTSYLYLCKLRAIISFPDSKIAHVKRRTTVERQLLTTRIRNFELRLKSPTAHRKKQIVIEIEGLKKFVVEPNWSLHNSLKIDRQYPGLQTVDKILVITEVLVANKMRILGSFDEDWKEWKSSEPVILGFVATTLKLDNSGKIIMERPMTEETVMPIDNWVRIKSSRYHKCAIINEVFNDAHYDLTCPLPARKDLIPIARRKDEGDEELSFHSADS